MGSTTKPRCKPVKLSVSAFRYLQSSAVRLFGTVTSWIQPEFWPGLMEKQIFVKNDSITDGKHELSQVSRTIYAWAGLSWSSRTGDGHPWNIYAWSWMCNKNAHDHTTSQHLHCLAPGPAFDTSSVVAMPLGLCDSKRMWRCISLAKLLPQANRPTKVPETVSGASLSLNFTRYTSRRGSDIVGAQRINIYIILTLHNRTTFTAFTKRIHNLSETVLNEMQDSQTDGANFRLDLCRLKKAKGQNRHGVTISKGTMVPVLCQRWSVNLEFLLASHFKANSKMQNECSFRRNILTEAACATVATKFRLYFLSLGHYTVQMAPDQKS